MKITPHPEALHDANPILEFSTDIGKIHTSDCLTHYHSYKEQAVADVWRAMQYERELHIVHRRETEGTDPARMANRITEGLTDMLRTKIREVIAEHCRLQLEEQVRKDGVPERASLRTSRRDPHELRMKMDMGHVEVEIGQEVNFLGGAIMRGGERLDLDRASRGYLKHVIDQIEPMRCKFSTELALDVLTLDEVQDYVQEHLEISVSPLG